MQQPSSPIWPGAWRLFKSNFGLLVCLSLVNTVVEAATGWSSAFGTIMLSILGSVVAGTVAAYAIHVSELKNQKFGASDLWTGAALPNRAFVSITFLVIFAIFLVGLVIWQLSGDADPTEELGLTVLDQMLIAVSLASLLAYIYFLCRFGTVFPAAAIDNDWSLKRAYDRGRGKGWTLARGLLIGPICAAILQFVFYWLLADVFYIDIYVWTEEGAFSPIGVGVAFTGFLSGFLITALGAVVFCNAYRLSKSDVPS